jgi:hypothetical protein
MADTTFASGTVIASTWLNDVNDHVYNSQGGSVLDYIPKTEHAAILAGTSTLDVSSYFNAAIAAHTTVYVPAGTYLIRYPINMTGRRELYNWGKRLIGEGKTKTIINGYTGVYPIIDTLGMNDFRLQGMALNSDNGSVTGDAADCASIGILMGRGAINTSANQTKTIDIAINLTSDFTRNGGVGTIGIVNVGCEHVYRDSCAITANLPGLDHNGDSLITISTSSSIPALGAFYEQPISGAVSCTISENRNMILISWDSYRAWWFHQVANHTWTSGYTSTRLLTTAAFAGTHTFDMQGGGSNMHFQFYQEVSGVFSGTYHMDHGYFNYISGVWDNITARIVRGVSDVGNTYPGAPVASVTVGSAVALWDSEIAANYLPNQYDASVDNNGMAANAVVYSAAPHSIRNVRFVLDSSTSGHAPSGLIASNLQPYCTNVTATNFYTGVPTDVGGTFTPVVYGSTAAGAATYTFQQGLYQRNGQWVDFTLAATYTGHTGTGYLRISGLPYTCAAQGVAVSVHSEGLLIGTGYQMTAWIPENQAVVHLLRIPQAGGATDGVAMDADCTIWVTGRYKIASSL